MLCLLVVQAGAGFACRKSDSSLVGDVTLVSNVEGMVGMSGRVYLKGNRIRIDWGEMADVFDLRTRKGWRLFTVSKAYQDLGSKDLSTYAPEMTNGSPCPTSEIPTQCKFLAREEIDGRITNKWSLRSSKGFDVYYWTDDTLGVTLRMKIGDAAGYEVKDLTTHSIPDSMFELPAEYQKLSAGH